MDSTSQNSLNTKEERSHHSNEQSQDKIEAPVQNNNISQEAEFPPADNKSLNESQNTASIAQQNESIIKETEQIIEEKPVVGSKGENIENGSQKEEILKENGSQKDESKIEGDILQEGEKASEEEAKKEGEEVSVDKSEKVNGSVNESRNEAKSEVEGKENVEEIAIDQSQEVKEESVHQESQLIEQKEENGENEVNPVEENEEEKPEETSEVKAENEVLQEQKEEVEPKIEEEGQVEVQEENKDERNEEIIEDNEDKVNESNGGHQRSTVKTEEQENERSSVKVENSIHEPKDEFFVKEQQEGLIENSELKEEGEGIEKVENVQERSNIENESENIKSRSQVEEGNKSFKEESAIEERVSHSQEKTNQSQDQVNKSREIEESRASVHEPEERTVESQGNNEGEENELRKESNAELAQNEEEIVEIKETEREQNEEEILNEIKETEREQHEEEILAEIKETEREQNEENDENTEKIQTEEDANDEEDSENEAKGHEEIPEEEDEYTDGEKKPHVEESPEEENPAEEGEIEEDEEKLLNELKALVKGHPVENEENEEKEERHDEENSPNGPTDKNQSPQGSPSGKSRSYSPNKAVYNSFQEYYDKFCKGFIQKREEELAKKRQLKEQEELAVLQDKPTLVSRPNAKKYVSIVDRTSVLNARREEELNKIRKEKEEKLELELKELTFMPKINERSRAILASSPRKEKQPIKQQTEYSPEPLFIPKINPNSQAIAEIIRENISDDVVDRLYHHYENSKIKREELIKSMTPKFTPSLNKTTRRIVQRIERNYKGGEEDPYNQIREVSDDEDMVGSPNGRVNINDPSSDLELLAILKQFNTMLKQKNEGPINMQQLNALMAKTAERRRGVESARNTYHHTEEGDGAYSHRKYDTEPSHRVGGRSDNMSNIERNLMQIQGNLKGLKDQDGDYHGKRSFRERNGLDYDSSSSVKRSGDLMSKLIHSPKSRANTDSYVRSPKNLEAIQKVLEKTESPKKVAKKKTKSKSKIGAEEFSSTKKNTTGKTKKSKSKSKSKSRTTHISSSKSQITREESPKLEKGTQTSKKAKGSDSRSELSSRVVESKNGIDGWYTRGHEHKEDDTFEQNNEEEERVKNNAIRPSLRSVERESSTSHKIQKKQRDTGSRTFNSKQESLENSRHGYVTEEEARRQSREREIERSHHSQEGSKIRSNKYDTHDQQSQGGYTSAEKNKRNDGRSSYASNQHEGHTSEASFEEERIRGVNGGSRHDSEFNGSQNEKKISEKSKNSKANIEDERSKNSIHNSRKESELNSSQKGKAPSEGGYAAQRKLREEEKAKNSRSELNDSRKGKQSGKSSRANVDEDEDHEVRSQHQSKSGSAALEKSKAHTDKRSQALSSKESSFDKQDPNKSHKSSSHKDSHAEHGKSVGKGKSSFYSNKEASSIQHRNNTNQSQKYNEESIQGGSDIDEASISLHSEKVKVGSDNVSFSKNHYDQKHSGSDNGQTEQKLLDELDSQTSKEFNVRQVDSEKPRKARRADPSTFSIVTTEMIQIHPTNKHNQSYTFSMGGVDQTFKAAPASSSGLKAMAEQIVRKFKAYDAQLKNTHTEFKISVSPPRSLSPATPEVTEDGYRKQKEAQKKVFKSVKDDTVSSRKDSVASHNVSQKHKPSLQGSLNSIHSGSYSARRNEDIKKSSVPSSVKSGNRGY